MNKLHLSKAELIQQYRRMIFNVIARNQDDHTKNIAFLMDQQGKWKMSPAFDVTYSHNPQGKWTNQHQMTINGKRDHFTLNDFISVAESINIPKVSDIIMDVHEAIEKWSSFAKEAGINKKTREDIGHAHRTNIV